MAEPRKGAEMVAASRKSLYVMGKRIVLMAVMRALVQQVSGSNFDLLTTDLLFHRANQQVNLVCFVSLGALNIPIHKQQTNLCFVMSLENKAT